MRWLPLLLLNDYLLFHLKTGMQRYPFILTSTPSSTIPCMHASQFWLPWKQALYLESIGLFRSSDKDEYQNQGGHQ